jgi:hypothetical protein
MLIGNEAPETSAPDGSRASSTPPVEQSASAQPTDTTQADQPPATDKGTAQGSAEGAGSIPEASPSGEPQTLELTAANLAEVINQLSKNQNLIVDEVKRLRDDVSSMRGGFSRKTMSSPGDMPQPGAQTQEGGQMPAILAQLAPVAMAAISKYLGGGEEEKKSTVATQLQSRLEEYQAKQMDKMFSRIMEAIEASDEDRLMIQPRPEGTKGAPQPK